MSVIGIDLGTTNSCVAILEDGKAKIIENQEGARTTPSVVAYTSNEMLVGATAKRQLVTNPKETFFAVKRFIGRKYGEAETQQSVKHFNYEIVRHENGDAWLENKGKAIPPAQISAAILSKMKKTAEDYLGHPVTEAVITVPAYFNDSQRQATKDAGKIAGLNVKRIINEPTAAALAFGVDKEVTGKILVYDLGGGTFDVSVIDIWGIDGEKQLEVLSTNGDTFLGGEDFDNALLEYVLDTFKTDNNYDLRKDSLALQRVKEAVEKAKIELSTAQVSDVNLPYITATAAGPLHLSVQITRSKFEDLVMNLVNRSFEAVEKALSDAKISTTDIKEVLLVGGMTRMPLVQEKVKLYFGKEPRKDVNPDEAVACGAAVQGGILGGHIRDLLLLDVIPLSFGIETAGGIFSKLVEKNTAIPTQFSQVFTTASDFQPDVEVHILQGERSLVEGNKSLGKFVLGGIRPAPRGVPKIEVTFDIDANGILSVSAKDKDTGVEQSIRILSASGLSDSEIERMKQDAENQKQKDEEVIQVIKLKNRLETLVSNAKRSGATQEWADEKGEKIRKIKTYEDANKVKEEIENDLTRTYEEEQRKKQASYQQQPNPQNEPNQSQTNGQESPRARSSEEEDDDKFVDDLINK